MHCNCSKFIAAMFVNFRLNTSECFTLGDVTTVNMTMVKGGVAYNVIPAEMDVSFDLRIPPTVNLQVCKCVSVCLLSADFRTCPPAQVHSPLTSSFLLF